MIGTHFNKSMLQSLRNDLNSAIAAIGQKHGIKLSTGNCRFTPSQATMKLEMVALTGDGKPVDILAESFNRYAAAFGITSKLGESVTIGCKTLTITGLNTKKRVRPVTALEKSSGRTFILTPAQANLAK